MMRSSIDLSVRTMTRSDLDAAVEWAAAEGWNPGLHDADAFYAADSEGFLVGEVDGEAVSCISAVRFGSRFGFLGFYIVAPGWRGRGYGLQLWNAAMKRMGDRTVGLDGVVAQQENYRKSGFVLAHNNARFEGRAGAAGVRTSLGIVPAAAIPFEALRMYDERHFLAPRSSFLAAWLNQPGSTAVAARGADGMVEGLGVLRPCRSGYKVGPLFAASRELAMDLLQSLLANVSPDSTFYLDVPCSNPEAVELARSLGMVEVFQTARMYRGEAPVLPIRNIFGITSFELG